MSFFPSTLIKQIQVHGSYGYEKNCVLPPDNQRHPEVSCQNMIRVSNHLSKVLTWKAKCPFFTAIVAGFRGKVAQKIGHLAFQVGCITILRKRLDPQGVFLFASGGWFSFPKAFESGMTFSEEEIKAMSLDLCFKPVSICINVCAKKQMNRG